VSVFYFTDRDLGLQFPKILQDAGLAVERHGDHFPADASMNSGLRSSARSDGWR
jgi:hypothetical protein